jgi:S1-C subfamily serine protease
VKRIWIGSLLALGLAAVSAAPAAAQDDFPSVKVAEMVGDSVVSIDVNSVAFGAVRFSGIESSRTGTLATRRQTGIIYSEDGYIVTDSNGIEDAALINVRLNDGTELTGEVIGVDSFYGFAVLKVDPEKKLKPVKILKVQYDPLNNVYPYDQGDSVVAIGNSGGFGGTVTYGIISAVRNFRNRNYVLLPSVIQADVVINTGNEGGPLFNDKGELIGMHDKRGGGGSMQNTTFFSPAVLVDRVAREIIADKAANDEIKVWHPWLGIKPFSGSVGFQGLRQFGDDLKMFMDIPDQYWDVGIAIDAVYPESPAREYGILNKDILMYVTVYDKDENVKHDYRLLKSIQELELMVTTAEEGDRFVFGVLRNSKLFDIDVIIGQHPGEFEFFSVSHIEVEDSRFYF